MAGSSGPRQDEWQTKTLPALKEMALSRLVKMSGMSRSALKEMRAGRSRPYPKNEEMLAALAEKLHTNAHDSEKEKVNSCALQRPGT
jgi:hypothetical protein